MSKITEAATGRVLLKKALLKILGKIPVLGSLF